MKKRPILFSGPMVRAILDGKKTQTRRVIKPQPVGFAGWWKKLHWASEKHFRRGGIKLCPYGTQAGDRLWVRETWAKDVPGCAEQKGLSFRADHNDKNGDGPTRIKWRPSIHMPRWASRITLELTGVRVERVQEISHQDCRAEGITLPPSPIFPHPTEKRSETHSHFAELWDSINAKRGFGWDVNPWVWVLEFKEVGA